MPSGARFGRCKHTRLGTYSWPPIPNTGIVLHYDVHSGEGFRCFMLSNSLFLSLFLTLSRLSLSFLSRLSLSLSNSLSLAFSFFLFLCLSLSVYLSIYLSIYLFTFQTSRRSRVWDDCIMYVKELSASYKWANAAQQLSLHSPHIKWTTVQNVPIFEEYMFRC